MDRAVKGAVERALDVLFLPRLVVCVAGRYPNGRRHCLDLETARKVIGMTRSSACVVRLPRMKESDEGELSILDLLPAFEHRDQIVPMLNTSRAMTCADAKEMIEFGFPIIEAGGFFGLDQEALIKLEILDLDLRSINEEILCCLRELSDSYRTRTVPMLNPVADDVARAIDFGCPAIRLHAGEIGQQTGIIASREQQIQECIARAHPIPVIFESGISSPHDVRESARLGAAAVLLNSAFHLSSEPVEHARRVREAADSAWAPR